MLSYLRDKLLTARLQARYQRLVHERLVHLTEASGPQPVEEDPDRWQLLGSGLDNGLTDADRVDIRTRARQLVERNPHAKNLLRLLESYVTGPGLRLTHQATSKPSPDREPLVQQANQLWQEFLEANQTHYSYREHARRAWRDGECFVRKFPSLSWPPQVRFLDPERIGPTPQHPESSGILTDPNDAESPTAYLMIDPLSGDLQESIPADRMLHTRIGVDSNQKRGLTILRPILDVLDCFDSWMKTELLARKLQSSIVLWRKVHGSPQQAEALAQAAQSGTNSPGGRRRERLQPGTILTTNQSTEIQFLQPQTNFGDAVPLGRMLLLAMAAGAGLPEFMLTADASNANYSSTMVAEGPAVKFFESEQAFYAAEFSRFWRWVMSEAIKAGLLPEHFFNMIEPAWTFPQLVNRDRSRERMADVRLVDSHILSRAEVARRDGVDPEKMQAEIRTEIAAQTDTSTKRERVNDVPDTSTKRQRVNGSRTC